MNGINWNRFMLKNSNPQVAFETMCRNIFWRTYKVSSHDFSTNYNQTGLETEPIFYENKYYGFQCKYSTSGNSTSLYAQVFESLSKAVKLYPNLNTVIIYTNLDIKPNVSSEDLIKSKNSNRVKIYELGQKNNLEILWFLKPNFENAMNEIENYDLYRAFFSPEDLRGLLNEALTHNERTFLLSNQFIDLSLNEKIFSSIKDDIIIHNVSVITGAAGTGKSEILKQLYLQCERRYLSNSNQVPSSYDTTIPVFVRLRECINGDLESLLRDRLKDFDISIANSKNQYIYFFDGIDEISALDFGGVVACLMRLKGKETTKGLILSSRTNTANLTTVLRNFKPEIYKIDSLKCNDVIDYFSKLNDEEKYQKLQEIQKNNSSLFDDITDIFSVVLLSDNIFQINKTTTKVDLIKLSTEKLVENNQKYALINLPESKIASVQKILGQVSVLMQRTGNISISRLSIQKIINKLFPNCSYLQTDEIIDFVSEMFFDSTLDDHYQRRYSYRHKRYFEFYLYIAIKEEFYDNPTILRDLCLLSNKDFIINIFFAQELKRNQLNNDILKVLILRFLETYLGEFYFRDIKISWQRSKAPLSLDGDSYLRSQQLYEYLCTKNIDDLRDFISNDPLSIKGFLSSDNYYSFVKQYHKINNIDIRDLLSEIYDIHDEWLEKARNKDHGSFLYCKYVIDNKSIGSLYDTIKTINDVNISDLDHYPYGKNITNILVEFFDLALDFFGDWILSIIDDISIDHLEILCYLLLKTHHLSHIIKNDALSPISAAICERIESQGAEQYGIHTVVLYSVLTKTMIHKEEILERSKKVNINHYETWRTNIELNSYAGMILGEEFRPCLCDYELGITLRKITNDSSTLSKSEVLSRILQEINKYNFVCKNWFSYYNSIFIGEIIATLDISVVDVNKFIVDLSKFDSVVSVFQVLHTVMRRNTELFKIIANPSLITSAYVKASQDLSYYDNNSDLAFMYATMYSHFDIVKADALFEIAINNSAFRPIFRNENMIDYHLPSCLFTAYNNHWFLDEEMELIIKRVAVLLEIARDTLDSGAYGEHFKYLVKHCCPQLSDIVQNINVCEKNPELDTGWELYSNKVDLESVNLDNLSDYYACEIDGINYLSIFVWKQLIGFELEKTGDLDILYKTLEKYYFPGTGVSNMSNCFHTITAALISNIRTKSRAIEFIMENSGRMGIIHLIKAYALIGDDKSGRQYLENLIKLCEAMVYPTTEYSQTMTLYDNRSAKIINIVCNSKNTDWDEDTERYIMHYLPDPKISIRWEQYDEQEPCNEKWAANHPCKEAFSTKYYIYYQEERIKMFDMVWVDGYRALIPMPDGGNNHINRKSYKLACLINRSVEELNSYILSSGLIVD